MLIFFRLLFLLFIICLSYQRVISGSLNNKKYLKGSNRRYRQIPNFNKLNGKNKNIGSQSKRPGKNIDLVPFPISLIYQNSNKIGSQQKVSGIYECFMKKMKNGKRKYQNLYAKTQRWANQKIYRFFYELEKRPNQNYRYIAMDFKCQNEYNEEQDIKFVKFQIIQK